MRVSGVGDTKDGEVNEPYSLTSRCLGIVFSQILLALRRNE
jgi:hypothetical protein